MSITIIKIPQSELKIMKFIWDTDYEISSKNITSAMENEYDWNASTTLSLLSKLVNRGFLEAKKIKRLTYYNILIKKRLTCDLKLNISFVLYIRKFNQVFKRLWFHQ